MIELRAKLRGFDRVFKLNAQRASDISEPLREIGAEIREDSKQTFEEERSRSGAQWAPLAASTQKRLEQTTVGPVNVRGEVRAKYIEQVSSYLKRKQKAGKYNPLLGQEFYRLTHGGSADEAIDESVRKSFSRLRADLRKTTEKRRGRKRQATRHKLLGKLVSMVRMQLRKNLLRVGIIKDSPLEVLNEGGIVGNGAKVEGRTFIELLVSDVDRAVKRLARWIVGSDEES